MFFITDRSIMCKSNNNYQTAYQQMRSRGACFDLSKRYTDALYADLSSPLTFVRISCLHKALLISRHVR